MLIVLALALAVFVLPAPWGVAAVVASVVLELAEAWFWLWLSRRRKPAVGIERLVGARAVVVTACRPVGQVRVDGELWRASSEAGNDPGDEVTVVAVDADGLTLRVEPA